MILRFTPVSKRIVILFLFFTVLKGWSQHQKFSLTGRVKDVHNKNIEIGNVIVLSLKDSSLITGNLINDGAFRIDGLKDSLFLIKISSLGYKDTVWLTARPKNDTLLVLNDIVMRNGIDLSAVEVIAKMPVIEDDGEKVKVNVENSILSSSGTIMDILRQTPRIMVDNNDNVIVLGRGPAIIYLDGQQITSVDVLKTISSSEVKNVEIISNPSSKYDASGRAIINIVTKKNSLMGYNGNVFQNIIYGKHLLGYSSVRLQVRKRKWGVSGSYGFNPGKIWSSDTYERNYVKNTNVTNMNNEIYNVVDQKSVNYFRFGANYFIDSSSSLNFQYDGFYSKTEEQVTNSNLISTNDIFQYELKTNTLGKPVLYNNSFNLNYSKKLDTLESEFMATAQYSGFSANTVELIEQSYKTINSSLSQNKRNNSGSDISLFTAQVSLDKSFSRKWKLETGIKNAYVYKTSLIRFENYSGGQWISDSSYLNGFKYDENILAGYVQARYKGKKWNARLGVRGEFTQANGYSETLQKTIISREYFNLFPSGFISYEFADNFLSALTYSRRIIRPVYQDMDPFINFIDSLSSFRGNPYLLPEYTNSLEWSLTYFKQVSLSVGYARTDGAIKLVVDRLNDGTDAFVAMKKNLNNSELYSFALNLPFETSWWTTYNSAGYYIGSYSYSSSSAFINNKKPNFYFYTYHDFRVKKLFSFGATFTYNSGGVDGIFMSNRFYVLSANIKKKFFNDKLVVRFIANDILSSGIPSGKSNVQGYDISYLSRVNSHYYLLSLNYKFGKLKTQEAKDKSINSEEYDRIKMNKKG
ncbi:MAG: TonB-dependent receptor [Bacteroidetes bacterium]|jgi:hypothetical protein|nr:TonB-dependent receptor [Bacteroidota bacterium]